MSSSLFIDLLNLGVSCLVSALLQQRQRLILWIPSMD